MDEFAFYLKMAGDFHGHTCAGIALGTRITLAALRYLGFNPAIKNKNLVVYVEVDRCMTDAVQAITRCSLGHRSLKFMDYGKFAAAFVNLDNGRAVRATVPESFDSSGPIEAVIARMAALPDSELVILKDIVIDIPPDDLPGHSRRRVYCAVCGERVMDNRDVNWEGRTLCRGCAGEQGYPGGRYYRIP